MRRFFDSIQYSIPFGWKKNYENISNRSNRSSAALNFSRNIAETVEPTEKPVMTENVPRIETGSFRLRLSPPKRTVPALRPFEYFNEDRIIGFPHSSLV